MPALLIDANLLVLFVVGQASRDLIGRHKRLQGFIPEDFDILLGLIERAPVVLVTPHALAEASNLVAYIAGPARQSVREALRALIDACTEVRAPSSSAAARGEFLRLGLTDCSLIEASVEGVCLLTTDADLYIATLNAKRQAINFNHLRQL